MAEQGGSSYKETSFREEEQRTQNSTPPPDTDTEIFKYSKHFEDDDRGDGVYYFALFCESSSASPARHDNQFGLAVTSLAYMALTGQKEGA